MLTQNDETVPNAVDLLDSLGSTGLKHVGCKEVGASPDVLKKLVSRVRALGGTSYLELVGSTVEESLAATDRAIELGFDCLFGGVEPERILSRCEGKVTYFPFAGRIEGHPVQLRGTAGEIAKDCQRLCEAGYPGIDLLLYRAVDDDHARILRSCRTAVTGKLFVAGSVNSAEKIEQLRNGGVDAFTIGSAVLNGSIFPEAHDLQDRVSRVLAICENHN